MSRRKVATVGGGVTVVMAGVAGAAGGQLDGNPWAWVCLVAALLVGGLVTAWMTWRTTDGNPLPPPDDAGGPPDRVQAGPGAVVAWGKMTVDGGVSTFARSDTSARPTPDAGPGWQIGPGAVAARRDMEIGGDVQTRSGGAGGDPGS